LQRGLGWLIAVPGECRMEGMKQKRVTADIEFGLETYLGRVRSMKNKENNCDDIGRCRYAGIVLVVLEGRS
jgi:hypothetical protein